MRMSCNGCRVLRKGCSEDCCIRPCLQWIKNPEAQGNATVFLAKFYGRAGLLNLINAGPEHLRPAIFRSLLYEACGRVVNPIYGSVGLLWSNNWPLCQAAVEAVLKGAPIIQIPSETAGSIPMPPLKSFDIRHVPKDDGAVVSAAHNLHHISNSGRTRFKRSGAKASLGGPAAKRALSHESSTSHEWGPTSSGEGGAGYAGAASPDRDSTGSAETVEDSMLTSHEEQGKQEVELELTLSLAPHGHGAASREATAGDRKSSSPPPKRCDMMGRMAVAAGDSCRVELGLDMTA